MDIYKSDKIFTKKFQFTKFFTKAVKKALIEKFGDRVHFNFEATQNVLIQSHTSRKTEDGVSGVRPFPFKLNIGETTGKIYVNKQQFGFTRFTVAPDQWEELSPEVVQDMGEYIENLLANTDVQEGEKHVIDIEVYVNIDENNYTPMNDPESLKLVRELEGKTNPSKQSKNELHAIADKISKEGVDPEVVTKIVEIVLATLPIVMKK